MSDQVIFKRGDCVKLLHGDSPIMVVLNVDAPIGCIPTVHCTYFNKQHDPKTYTVSHDLLRKVGP